MKLPTKFILTAACLALAVSLPAQTLLDGFSSTANWGSNVSLVGSGASFNINGSSAAHYMVGVSEDSEFVSRSFTGQVGSYTSDWSVRIDVHYDLPSGIFDQTYAQAVNVGLMVTRTGASLGVTGSGPTFDAFLANSNLYWNGTAASRDIRSSVFVANAEPTDMETRYAEVSNVTTAMDTSVRISFNATTKVLTASYDANGSAGGHSFTAMTTALADTVDASTWGMTGADTFTFHIVGNSLYDGGATGVGPGGIALNEVTLAWLVGEGAISAIPEPATYAVIVGGLALGLVAVRRRRTVAAA